MPDGIDLRGVRTDARGCLWREIVAEQSEVGAAERTGNGDGSREAAILSLAPLARRIARRHARGAESVDDLEQVALIGLIKAVDRFDPERGTALRFAAYFIEGEVRHHLRDNLGRRRSPGRSARRSAGCCGRAASSPPVRALTDSDELAAELDGSPGEIDAGLMVGSALARPSPTCKSSRRKRRSPERLGEEDR